MSLTTTAKNTKLAFWLTVTFVVVFLFGRYIFIPIAKDAYNKAFPPKNPPNPAFGLLEPLEFEPQKILNTTPPKFTLFTKDGRLPIDLPNRATVYTYAQPVFSYEAGKRASIDAGKLGFSDTSLSTSLKGNEYRWVDPATGASLFINTTTSELEMKVPAYSLFGSFKPGSINRVTAPSTAKNILQDIGRFWDPLYAEGTQTVEMGVIRNNGISYTAFQGEAEVARVDFFRSINNIPIVGPIYKEGLIRLIVGNPNKEDAIKRSPYIYYNVREIVQNSQATYPLLPISTVWEEVAKGNGVISFVRPATQSIFEEYKPIRITEVLITDVFLAYYDDSREQPYLQPIYVFEGNYTGPDNTKGNIAIYYPAVSGEYVKGTKSEVESNLNQ
ncbi:hypothetical protein KBG31_01425 [Patescibacteria group bacterium]|nr:hypothetical protein [Patescibacteria group bacterium]